MSNTKVTVTMPGNANRNGVGILPDPVIAFENCPVIHQATMFRSDRQL